MNKGISTNRYSFILPCLSLIFSLYSLVRLYLDSSPLWLIVGLTIPFIILVLLRGVNQFPRFFPLASSNKTIYKILFSCISIIFSISSMYGLFLIFNILPFNDKSVLFLPYIVCSFLIVGVSLGLFHKA